MSNILVIDDDEAILNMLRLLLTELGHNVETTADGKEGIQKIDENLFDLVITDILMPGIDGKDVVKHIRNSDRAFTPVIGSCGTPGLSKDNDFDTVILKPYSIKTLVDTVNKLVAMPSMEESGG